MTSAARNPIESITFGALPEFPQMYFMSVRNSIKLWRIYHETYSIATILPETGGLSEWGYRRRIYQSGKNNLIVVEPGEVHDMRKVSGPGSYDVMMLKPSAVEELARAMDMPFVPHLAIPSVQKAEVFMPFLRFLRAMRGKVSSLELESRLIRSLSGMLRHCMERVPRGSAVASIKALSPAMELLKEKWNQKVSLGQLATLSRLSRYHFLRAFSRHFGLPPHAFQNQLRITKAQELIKAGIPMHLLDLGFSDQSHFTRHFKSIVGVTPGRYAEMFRRPFCGASK